MLLIIRYMNATVSIEHSNRERATDKHGCGAVNDNGESHQLFNCKYHLFTSTSSPVAASTLRNMPPSSVRSVENIAKFTLGYPWHINQSVNDWHCFLALRLNNFFSSWFLRI